jgi:predicted transcriptional regulator
MHVMANRTKRTYRLRTETVTRVRELAARYGTSQDALVDTAIDRLAREARHEDEARAWESATNDPAFNAESDQLRDIFDRPDHWPA